MTKPITLYGYTMVKAVSVATKTSKKKPVTIKPNPIKKDST